MAQSIISFTSSCGPFIRFLLLAAVSVAGVEVMLVAHGFYLYVRSRI